MEGPYRDLGRGFARLTGVEGVRRAPSRITSVEAALLELLRNARDAGARNVYVSSVLHQRRYRTLTVIDDGCGVPEAYKERVFEPGVTTRHLSPNLDNGTPSTTPHGAGLALHHIKSVATRAAVVSASSPTSIQTTFDTNSLPERSLQSGSRPSNSNLQATLINFLDTTRTTQNHPPTLYLASPARILAILLENRIIQSQPRATGMLGDTGGRGADGSVGYSSLVCGRAAGVGLEVSRRTVQRVLSGQIPAAEPVYLARRGQRSDNPDKSTGRRSPEQPLGAGPSLDLSSGEISEIRAILERAARERYLELEGLELYQLPGEVSFKARVYEPEDEYDG